METNILSSENELRQRDFGSHALPHINSLYRFALYMSGNESDSQDLVQDTYLRAYRFFDKFEKGTDCKAWLFTILRNTYINKCRRDRRCPTMLSMTDMEERGMELSDKFHSEDEITGDMFGDEVYEAIAGMPDIYRTVVLLADVEDLSYKDIASVIGHPIGTVMSRLYRGRRILRQRLMSYATQYGYAIA